jgi:hypothetical protein
VTYVYDDVTYVYDNLLDENGGHKEGESEAQVPYILHIRTHIKDTKDTYKGHK